MRAAELGRAKVARIRDLLRKYRPFMLGDVAEAFWDRILRHSVDLISLDPTPGRLAACLDLLEASGLRGASNYHQFLSEVQATWPQMRLTDEVAAKWVRTLNHLDPEILTEVRDGRFTASERPAPKAKKKPQKGQQKKRRGRHTARVEGR
jgi:hypothetical protein